MKSEIKGSVVMNGTPVSDGRPPRRGEGITSASSHPELVNGDLAIPPRPYASVTSMNRSVASAGSRPMLGTLVLLAIAAFLSTLIFGSGTTSDDAAGEPQRLARSCVQWHLAAGAVVARLVQSTRDADLLQVNDAVFRMRRARRNCEAGWFMLACQDYHAVTTGAPGIVLANQVFSCSRVADSS
jgi:hypothetical protein